tara:strand:- start:827 stop:1582 length:756 start_codon:yes stop_codon:yes gene_type:complete
MKKTILFTALSLITLHTTAAIINVNFEGTIDRLLEAECTEYTSSCNDWDFEYVSSSNFYNNNLISTNDIFSGLAVIDTSGDYSLSSDGYQAIYSDATQSANINVSGLSFPNATEDTSSIGDSVSIVDNRSGRDLLNVSTWFSGTDYFASFGLYLHDTDGSVFSDLSIPAALDFSMFEALNLSLNFVHRPTGDQLHIDADITNISYEEQTTSSVEPSSVGEPPLLFHILFFGLIIFALKEKSILTNRRKAIT